MSGRTAERRGLLAAFSAYGLLWGAWSAVLPDVQERTGTSDGALGLALGALAVAALPAMPLAGRLVDRHGARRLLPAALLAFGVAGSLPGLATSPLGLVLALVALGATSGLLDVVANTATAAWERAEADRLLNAVHGCFSAGVLGGAVVTGLARGAGATPPQVLTAAGVLLLVTGLAQPAYRRVVQAAAGPARRRPPALLLGLGALIAAAFLVEDAVQTWSALHVERDLGAPPEVGGLGPGLFAGAMAAGRFTAHAVHRPGSETRLVVGGAGLLTAGVLAFALAPVAWLALAGAALAGAGVSVLAPTLLSVVGARSAPGRQGADMALVTTLSYLGFVLGPVLVGVVSAATTLPTALALLSGLAAAIALSAPVLLRTPPAGDGGAPPGQAQGDDVTPASRST